MNLRGSPSGMSVWGLEVRDVGPRTAGEPTASPRRSARWPPTDQHVHRHVLDQPVGYALGVGLQDRVDPGGELVPAGGPQEVRWQRGVQVTDHVVDVYRKPEPLLDHRDVG